MVVIPYIPYMSIVKGSFYGYQGKIWEALKNYAKSPLPKENTIWREYKAPASDPRDLVIADYEKKLNTQITITAKLPAAPYLIKDMIAYIIMQQNHAGGEPQTDPPPVNVAPTANAGTDQEITLPVNSVALIGTDNDTDGSIVSRIWSQSAGPALQGFTGTNTNSATAVFNQAGTYVFIYAVTDDKGATTTDSVSVVVNPAIVVPNQGPSADAGPDNTVTLPTNSVQLNGTALDSDGVIASYLWEQIIGPNTAPISNPNIPNPTVGPLIEGVYVFRLTATDDDGATAQDTVQITVNPEPAPGEGINLPAPDMTAAPAGLSVPGTSEPVPTVYSENAPPLALDVRIDNKYFNRVGERLKFVFTYFDAENSAPGAHIYKVYRRSKTGTETLLQTTTSNEYLIPASDIGYGLKAVITPVSTDGVQGIPVSTMYTDYVVTASPTYPKATLNFTGVSGVVTGVDSIIRSSSAADGKGRTVSGFTGKGYVRFKNAAPGSYSGFGGGKKNTGNYGITFGMEFAGQFHENRFEAWETGGRTHTEYGPVVANSYIWVIRDLNTDANGNPIPGTWAIYYAYCPDKNGVPRRFKKSTQSINGTTPIGLDFLINNPFVSGQGFNGLEIAGEQIVTM